MNFIHTITTLRFYIYDKLDTSVAFHNQSILIYLNVKSTLKTLRLSIAKYS